jgi:hypothetical protein
MRILLAIVVALASALPEANAQRSKPPVPSDTLLVRALTAGIVEVLRDDLTWQIFEGRATPWMVVVQDSTVIPWGQVQRGLRQLLVRPDAAHEVSRLSKLEVGAVQLRGDTAFVEVYLLARTVSPSGCVSEGGMSYLVRSLRREGRWSVATVRPRRDELPLPCK